ncbi:MAG TPA: PIN domain-containing protein [Dermatophilaceae bacterium]|nr:PIN domain-containing protein [Dermatophilaceae bacterium]
MARVFVDTNVLAYVFDEDSPDKQSRARAALASAEDPVVSTQVMLELFTVLTRKFARPLSATAACDVLDRLSDLPVVSADAALVRKAARTATRHQLSVWDAMILEAAVEAGCSEVWTEDLATGSVLGGVRVVDPLR